MVAGGFTLTFFLLLLVGLIFFGERFYHGQLWYLCGIAQGTRVLPGLETANTYPCFGGAMLVEAVISVSLNFLSDLFPSNRDTFSHDLRSHVFLDVFPSVTG